MIDLYAAPTTNGLRAKIMLDECGFDYSLHKVNMKEREHKTSEFLALNPMGMIPVIIDHDGPGGQRVKMAQSVAILFYLAEKSGKFLPKDPAVRSAFWEPMMNAATDFGPTYGAIAFIGRWPGEKAAPENAHAKDQFQQRFRDYCGIWDARLATQRYCAGDDVTIADFACFGIFTRAKDSYPEMATGFANMDRWHGDIAARPGVRKGMAF